MGLSIWQLLLVVILLMLLFGRGKIPALMSDLAVGIKNFKSGIKEEEKESPRDAQLLDNNQGDEQRSKNLVIDEAIDRKAR